MESKLRIGVIFGGMSSEGEVSLATGRYVYSLLDPVKFVGIPLYLDKLGNLWQVPDKLVIQNTTADVDLRLEKDASRIRFEDIPQTVDVVFNALLGKYGEDGCIQSVLELIGVPYTGSGILASALGMDKKIHKRFLSAAGYKVAKDILIQNAKISRPACAGRRSGRDPDFTSGKVQNDISEIKNEISLKIDFPCVVKPTREGSSMGVSVVKSGEGLDVAFEYAFKYDNEALVEEYLRGLEFTCVVWGNNAPVAMLPTEIVFEGDFFTYEGKYMPGRTQTITPARLTKEVIEKIQSVSVEIYKLIGCVGYGRVDGFVVPKVKEELSKIHELPLSGVDIYITEPHTGTIMIPSSFVFQQASKFRIELDDRFTGKKTSTSLTPRMLVGRIIEMAVEAHQNKKGLL